jgi:hypothetical protein
VQFQEYFQNLSEFTDYFSTLELRMQFTFWDLWAVVGAAASQYMDFHSMMECAVLTNMDFVSFVQGKISYLT